MRNAVANVLLAASSVSLCLVACEIGARLFADVGPSLLVKDPVIGKRYVAGFDGPPVQGDYPTSLWAPGEIIVDTHSLNLAALPRGEYYLLAGLYNPATGERLPAATSAGPLPDDAVNLGPIRVAK